MDSENDGVLKRRDKDTLSTDLTESGDCQDAHLCLCRGSRIVALSQQLSLADYVVLDATVCIFLIQNGGRLRGKKRIQTGSENQITTLDLYGLIEIPDLQVVRIRHENWKS